MFTGILSRNAQAMHTCTRNPVCHRLWYQVPVYYPGIDNFASHKSCEDFTCFSLTFSVRLLEEVQRGIYLICDKFASVWT